MNVIQLKTMIYTFLSGIATRVYDGQAPIDPTYPYVVYKLASSYVDEDQRIENFRLEIDIWDNKPLSATAIETLTGSIDGDGAITSASGLHRKHYYVGGTLQADFYRDSRFDITDEDPKIKRRQLNYLVKSYLY
ncbi:MAG: hypothetical protein WC477_05960 [Patescibacteria group bacterium]